MSKERIKPSQFQIFDSNVIGFDETISLSDDQKTDLESLYAQSIGSFKAGSILIGKVIDKDNDGITVDINHKSNGIVPSYEFNPIELKQLQIGSPIEVMIEELENADGVISLSYEKAKASRAWERVNTIYKNNQAIEGVVTSKVKGGLYVDIGITAFLPGSQIDVQRVTDFDQWIGQKITAYIIKLIPKRGNVIISRRKYIHEQKSEVRKGVLENISEGQIIVGVVKNITKYGAFVDVGGVDGLLHITDMTWSRIEDPNEVLKIGDEVTVKILSFDRLNEKISLGMKQLAENPWDQLDASVESGSVVKGTIISIKDYGIFVEVARGVEGLVHISEISWTDRITDLHKHFKVGQEIEALVVSLERKNRRMSLSIKQLEKSPWEAVFESYEIGQKVHGKVTNIADFGFFVQIAPGVDGLVHVSDISWTQHIKHPSEMYKKDDMVDAVVIDINKQKRKISLSIKALAENPWLSIGEKLPVGSQITGTVIKIAEFGAFVRLDESGIEAFIHSSECSETPNTPVEEAVKVGQNYSFRVIRVSPEEQKIGLSLRKSHGDDSRRSSGGDRGERSERSSGEGRGDRNDRGGDRGPKRSGERTGGGERSDRGGDRSEKRNDRGGDRGGDRNDRGDRGSYAKSNKDKAPSQATSSSASSSTKKSALQIELEKLMQQQSKQAKDE